mgnify:FL=1
MSRPVCAIVTGASSGIGLAVAQRLVNDGYQVANWDLRAPTENHAGIHFVQCDVSQEEAIKTAFEQTTEKLGTCGVLVNNCGLQFMSPIEEFPVDKWEKLIGIMLTGTFMCTKTVLPNMRTLGKGRIINISSVHGKLASPFKSAYVAAKHGVLGFAKVAAIEAAPHKITVNTICPGFVDTPLMREQVKSQMALNNLKEEEVLASIFLKDSHIKQLTTPSQVADMVAYLVSDSAATITGEAFNISGGWGMGL